MRKLLLFLAAPLTALAIGAAPPAHATVACTSNIVDGSAAYDGTSTLSGTIQTGADALTPVATCKSVAYSAVISYTSSGTHVVKVASQKGDGTSTFLRFSFSSVSSDSGAFCVALFSSKGNTTYDTAPSTADLSAQPTPVPDGSGGFTCSSGWVATWNVGGSSGGGGSGFAG
jgi:hypothetical protein